MRITWAEQVARMGKMGNTYKIIIAKREVKTLLGRRKCKWKNNKLNSNKTFWPI